VAAEDLFVDDSDDRQTVETVRERLPQLDTVPTLTYARAHTHTPLLTISIAAT